MDLASTNDDGAADVAENATSDGKNSSTKPVDGKFRLNKRIVEEDTFVEIISQLD
jgi:hypothetical protein